MSKNNYKCLINTSAPSCVIIITISAGINHSCNTLGTLNTHCTQPGGEKSKAESHRYDLSVSTNE